MTEKHEITPIQRLVLAAAGKGAPRAETIIALDNECARIAVVAKEPLMAQIRLAWWRDGLIAREAVPAHRSPIMDALREIDDFEASREALVAIIDGWEELILWDGADAADMLERYAAGRGRGLFAALHPAHAERSAHWGRLWALWDLSGHLGDEALGQKCIGQGHVLLEQDRDLPGARLPRMLAMLAGAAHHDVSRKRRAPARLTPGLYMRLIRLQALGR
ncbi:MAG: hypothetical protein EP321_05670 [Sphingomonadales bacterium]|nr:MAG: hypothetical protein EP345_01360 [Sphingomonadales bacterium]TNF04877.1 MAG: hypothetical protein EP321_05670 [Sphingomonadales bacterium]